MKKLKDWSTEELWEGCLSLVERDDADERADFCQGDLYESIDVEGKR